MSSSHVIASQQIPATPPPGPDAPPPSPQQEPDHVPPVEEPDRTPFPVRDPPPRPMA